jgi:hypothetical protein
MPSWRRPASLVVVAIGAGRLAVSDDLAALAAKAYVYGFALVFDLQGGRPLCSRGHGISRASARQHLQPRYEAGRPGRAIRIDQ